jgi:hypothetical protein
VLWNIAGALREPLLSLFPHRAYLDLDPGVTQLSAAEWDIGLGDHHSFLTVGAKVGQADCQVPTLGLPWKTFLPFVFLPMWPQAPDPGPHSPFTSVTHWDWYSLPFEGRLLSISKRDAYLRQCQLPHLSGAAFELAVTGGGDEEGNARMIAGGWRIVDAWQVAGTPDAYRAYIGRSRGEICCPKPIHRELRTGWGSDRSVCYLATGRPVVMEDTGISDHVPVGGGLVVFNDVEDAPRAVEDVMDAYGPHSRAGRELVEDLLASDIVLPQMLSAS